MTDRELLASIVAQIHAHLSPPIDCVWAPWPEWPDWLEEWTANDDGETESRERTRFRSIATPEQNGGAPCVGPAVETERQTRTIPNERPIVALALVRGALVGEPFEVDTTGTHDPEGGALTGTFDWGDGQTEPWTLQVRQSHIYATPGARVIRFRAVDPRGLDGFIEIPVSVAPVPPPPPTNEHEHFDELRARPDCVFAYSLRDAVQVARYAPKNPPYQQLSYIFPNDPDPRAQDAMKLYIREGDVGIFNAFIVPIGPSHGQNLLFRHEVWFGNEFRQDYSLLWAFKESPIAFHAKGQGAVVDLRTGFRIAQNATHTLPPGGPYVYMTVPHALGKAPVLKHPDTWMSGESATLRVEMPATAPAPDRRYYDEGIGPMEAEFGVVAERWTEYVHFFERRPSEDWISDADATRFPKFSGKLMNAYAYSLWGADTERAAVRILDERIVGILAEYPEQFMFARFSDNPGNAAEASKTIPNRGALVGYRRNWTVHHGASKADVLAIVQRMGPRAA